MEEYLQKRILLKLSPAKEHLEQLRNTTANGQ